MSLLWEWWGPRMIGFACGLVYLIFFREISIPQSIKEIFTSVLTITSITVGFLITAAGTLLGIQDNNRFLRLARDAGAYRLLIEYIISAARWNFIAAILSAGALLLDWRQPSRLLSDSLALWLFVMVTALMAIVRVFRILEEVLRTNAAPEDD
jgi:hypothetical protein